MQGHARARPYRVEYLQVSDAVVDVGDLAVVGLKRLVEPVQQVPLRHGRQLVAADGRHHVRGIVVVHACASTTDARVPNFISNVDFTNAVPSEKKTSEIFRVGGHFVARRHARRQGSGEVPSGPGP